MASAASPGLGRALALGLLHGPAELLPISSSGHVELVPWLLGWDYVEPIPRCARRSRSRCTPGTAAALVISCVTR